MRYGKPRNRKRSFARTRESYRVVRLARQFAPRHAGDSLAVLRKMHLSLIWKSVQGAIVDAYTVASAPFEFDWTDKADAHGVFFPVTIV